MILADTHVHLYPFADLGRLLDGAATRLSAAANGRDADRVLLLTERYDCRVFDAWADGSASPPAPWTVAAKHGDTLMRLERDGAPPLWLGAGHQVVTAERVEVLGLLLRDKPDDGRTAEDTVRDLLDRGAIPVLSWAPGKWLGPRGRSLTRLLGLFGPDQIALGDTTLRAIGIPVPTIMKAARTRGYRVLHGSDPLPLVGEETVAGQYASRLDTTLDPDDPEASLRHALLDPAVSIASVGRRDAPWTTLRRLLHNHKARRPPS